MLTFPNAKINIGLNVLSKREDGYHNIETCIYPIPWRDVLEVVKAKEFKFVQTGLPIDGDPESNLCVRAYHILKKDFDLAPIEIHLHKVIPMGAGLGGGSSDGAATLKLINAVFELGLSIDQLENYATQLGSDCPFFIRNVPVIAKGTGTTLSPIDLDLSNYFIAIVHPGIHVNTKNAYQNIQFSISEIPIWAKLKMEISSWQDEIINDFEKSALLEFPEIEKIKKELLEKGAIYASMSGSGSAVYGLFDSEPTFDENFKHRIFIKLLEDQNQL